VGSKVEAVDRQPQWRGQRDTLRWRLRALIVASALLHAPLSPVGALLGLVSLLHRPGAEGRVTDLNAITAIPVELLGEQGGLAQPEPAAPEPAPEPTADLEQDLLRELEQSADSLATIEAQPEPADAGLEESEAGDTDAGAPEPGLDLDAGVETDAAAELDAGLEAGLAGPADPVALTGSAGQVANANANVRLLMYTERIRNHPLGARVRELLRNTPQWQDFFGTGRVDPIADVDRILIAGPQLRDSAEVVAVLRYNAAREKVRAAVDRLVRRSPGSGGWLDAGVPAAQARADGSERVFVMPAPNIVVVAPPSASQHALSLPSDIEFPAPSGSEAISVYLVTPWRALLGLPLSIPQSIKWARISITPTAAGGAVARATGLDESEEAAKRSAAAFRRLLAPYTVLDFVERVDFRAQGAEIHGEVEANKNQLAFLLELARQQQQKYAQMMAQRRAGGAKAPAPQSAGSQAPGKHSAGKATGRSDRAAQPAGSPSPSVAPPTGGAEVLPPQ
jgi:hypothetical protein